MGFSFLFKTFLFLLCHPFSLESKPLRVSLDPGHGGSDHGAVWRQINESDINLKIAMRLYKILKKDPFFDPLLLRKKDKFLALSTRLKMSRQFDSDLFISIHVNAHKNQKIHGSEFYIQKPQIHLGFPKFLMKPEAQKKIRGHRSISRSIASMKPKIHKKMKKKKTFLKMVKNRTVESRTFGNRPLDENVKKIIFELKESNRLSQSRRLASLIHRHWGGQNSTKKIKYGPFYILDENPSPAILIEVGYLTNPSERQKLIQNQVQQAIAQKIHTALRNYVKKSDKGSKSF